MLETIAIILIVLWLLGFVSSYTMGGFIHILLVVAVIVILVRVIQGRRINPLPLNCIGNTGKLRHFNQVPEWDARCCIRLGVSAPPWCCSYLRAQNNSQELR